MIGLARPAGAMTLWAALAFFATGASAQTTPAPMLPGAPWAAPVLPPSLAQPGARGAVPPDKLRPAEHNLIDCKGARHSIRSPISPTGIAVDPGAD